MISTGVRAIRIFQFGAFILFFLLSFTGCQGSGVTASATPSNSSVTTTAPVIGNDYYVANEGADSTNGSLAAPWKTLTRVNSASFSFGDRIHFKGGQTFGGQLSLQTTPGTSESPVTFDSYGTGKAILSNPSDHVISIYNSGNYIIQNLIIQGGGASSNHAKTGIQIYNDLAGNVKMSGIKILDSEVRNAGGYGIEIGGGNGRSGFSDVTILRVDAHDNGLGGIQSYGNLWNTPGAFAHSNIYIGYVRAYNNLGVAGWSNHSGNGIVLGGVDGGTIEKSVAHDNGVNNIHVGGPVGIWAWDSNNIKIQFNEAYSNRTSSTADGGGFDLDGGVSNSVMQYNYSHDNDGAGFLISAFPTNVSLTNNVIRFNISENDGRKNGYGGITLYDLSGSRVSNIDIYNNTVYISAAASGTPRAVYIVSGSQTTNVRFFNNTFVSKEGTTLIYVPSNQPGIKFLRNNYFVQSGTPDFKWNGTSYNSLSTWKTASGTETISSTFVGLNVDPLFTSFDQAITVNNPDSLVSLSAYRLQNGSPLLGMGLNLSSYGISAGTAGFFGNTVSPSIPNLGAY